MELPPNAGAAAGPAAAPMEIEFPEAVQTVIKAQGRGLHSSTLQLNLSALYMIEGARGGCVARIKGGVGGV